MKTTQIREVIALNAELNAIIEVERLGQESVEQGDRVVVEATLYLPNNKGASYCLAYLHPDLRFSDRISSLMGETLRDGWGDCVSIESGYRHRTRRYKAEKWCNA